MAKIIRLDANKIVDDVQGSTDEELVVALGTIKSFLAKYGADEDVTADAQKIEQEISRRKVADAST